MNISAPFIRRPVATTLMAVGIFLAGAAAYFTLPVASLPAIELPIVRIMATRPGADPATMAASVAAPLERRLSEISGVTEMTSTSTLGSSVISMQFDADRPVDKAARDVQAALNAAATDLPSDLPTLPIFRKANPAAMPVIIFALTSDSLTPSALYDAADTVLAQRLSQVEGVAEVQVNGAQQPAIRIQADAARLAATRVSLTAVANAVVAANSLAPTGSYDGPNVRGDYATSGQISQPEEYRNIVIQTASGPVRLGDLADVQRGVVNSRGAGWFNNKPAVLLLVTKQADANVIDTVERVKATMQELRAWIPAGIDVVVLSDRTTTIRASFHEIQRALMVSIALVMAVVAVFLRRAAPMVAAGLTVPLSLAGTLVLMYFARFSLDNISLMAIIVSVGFVVDDAIVIIENIHRNIEQGKTPFRAALEGARQISFTVISISLSLAAAFVPMIFLGGIPGKLFREFSLTVVFAIAVSTFISLTVTPMICAHYMKPDSAEHSRLDRLIEGGLAATSRFYSRSLYGVLRHPWIALLVMLATIGVTVQMFRTIPKGYIPQDDTGLIFSFTEASPDVSFPAMAQFQQQAAAVIMADPDVQHVASFIGGSNSVNQGRIFIALKPTAFSHGGSAAVINRLRGKLARVPGVQVFMFQVQDLRGGGRQSKSQYQYTLWDPNFSELDAWTPKILARMRRIPQLADVTTDREQGGLQANVVIDRDAASRLGVKIQDIDTALNTAFGQRQASVIYTQRNQYRVVIETTPGRQRDPNDISTIYVPGPNGSQVALSAIARVERSNQPLAVNHQGPFPSATISFNLAPDATLDAATRAIEAAVSELSPPETLRAEFAGDAKDFRAATAGFGMLIAIALVSIYLILGILYESLIHPITILSTLPSAGLGALFALKLFNTELTLIAFIGIILLIGIVKKNGIMLVDFAIEAERKRALPALEAAHDAAVERFRPILMTTLAALFGALPLAFAHGAGAAMRQPLGIAIVGGLVLSQILTLYTTPVIFMLMDKLSRRKPAALRPAPVATP
ncbi:MAG: efflux RND transporter permease subunit [Hyphomicrobiales bacterium]|nr:efflux RND transporter permease subunit [Hyphomicrobiales bacterium]